MARIAFAWELGSDLGHAVACVTLAQALQAHGHEIALVFRELGQLAYLPESKAFDVFQAPRSAREGEVASLPASYADILLAYGYGDAGDVAALVSQWRALLQSWRADLVVADFAPTALLAARTLALPRVTYGNGFNTPPRLDPLPSFRFAEAVPMEHLVESDRRALANVNSALAGLGIEPLARLADLFETDEDFLCTFPRLDHYGTRGVSGYWGPRLRLEQGLQVDWPRGTGKRVFVYLRSTLPELEGVMDHLSRTPHQVLAIIPGLDEARRGRYANARRRILDRPVRLGSLLPDCDLVVSHGGEIATGTTLRGVAQLCFPQHYEQYITARRLEQIGNARWLPLGASRPQIAEALEQMLSTPQFKLAALAFSKEHAAFTPAEQRRRIVARLEDLLSQTQLKGQPS